MKRRRLLVRGTVQGVGFRPWVARTARALGLAGSVRNTADGVSIELQGDVDAFVADLAEAPPPIDARIVSDEPLEALDDAGFVIVDSDLDGARRPSLPPDLATCDACLRELADPSDRRFGYALISCAACGPRYSLAGPPPFDRERTAMARFPHCPACAAEHEDPTDRRYHAQVSACAACGPTLSMSIPDAAAVIRRGGILAVKGASGFQLLCDARDEAAVQRLRALKGRPDKPLAVLAFGAPDGGGPDAPIVLCDAALELAPSVLRGARQVGWMRPPTAVHHLLLQALDGPLVCTSANRSGEPLAAEASEVQGLCDAVLDHDRAIWRAPRPLPLGGDGPTLLAVGADLKSAVTLALGDEALMSPHLGTLGPRRVLELLEREIESLCTVYDARPDGIVCDAHPDLVSSWVARSLSRRWGVPLRRVHHHHAHIAAVCAEHGVDGPVIGFAWDGVGLGPDGGVWGGEVLRVDGASCERLAHLAPFALPGGDACARDPARVALALRHAAGLPLDPDLHPHAAQLWRWLDRAPRTCTSMGRLLDGLAVLAGLPSRVTFEAQLPIALMEAAGPSVAPWPLAEAPLDWRPWIRALVEAREPLPVVARRVHETLIAALVTISARSREPIALGGGCFQNRLLVEGAAHHLGDRLVLAERVPPGDGGLSYGQAWIARR